MVLSAPNSMVYVSHCRIQSLEMDSWNPPHCIACPRRKEAFDTRAKCQVQPGRFTPVHTEKCPTRPVHFLDVSNPTRRRPVPCSGRVTTGAPGEVDPQPPAGYPGGPCCTQACRCTAYPELLHAIVDAALVLVDVGPGVAGGALWGDVPRRGLGDAVEPSEKAHLHSTRGRPPQHACTNGNASTPATSLSREASCVRAARTPRHPHTFSSTMPRGTESQKIISYCGRKAQIETGANSVINHINSFL